MYATGRIIVSKKNNPALWDFLDNFAHLANNLRNSALFILRQNLFMYKKSILDMTDLEIQVRVKIDKTMAISNLPRPKSCMSKKFLEKLMRVTNNPDFFAGLPMQTAQMILQNVVQDMKNWFSSLRVYKKNPELYTGKPKIPKYSGKGSAHTFTISNQDCVIYCENGESFLKFPLTKLRLKIENMPEDARLKEVKVKPFYDSYEVLYTYEVKSDPRNEDLRYYASIDFGVNNTAAIVTNEGNSLLVKGGAVKAENQWFNKRKAHLVSELTTGKTHARAESRQLTALSKNRALFIRDYCHQVSSRIIKWCLNHKVGTLVLGKNKFWKQNCNIGGVNNQNFTNIPFEMLRNMIQYKAERVGIRVIFNEESYTSKASFIDNDYVPTYGVDDCNAKFSGKRIKRGLYKSADGIIINADLNGAANILKKAVQDAFENVTGFDFLKNPEVLRYTDLHKSNPVKRIVAV